LMSLNLTPEEIQEITGRTRKDAQIRQLRYMRLNFKVNGDGRPIVLRAHYERVMDGTGKSSHDRDYQPNYDALNG